MQTDVSTLLLAFKAHYTVQHRSFTHALLSMDKCFPSNIHTHSYWRLHQSIRSVSRPRILWHAARDQNTNVPISRWPELAPELQPPQQHVSQLICGASLSNNTRLNWPAAGWILVIEHRCNVAVLQQLRPLMKTFLNFKPLRFWPDSGWM